jgi:hypothetical protein
VLLKTSSVRDMAEETLDASKFKPINVQSTVLLVNQMILQTTTFLNQFSSTVERKISKVSAKVTQLEIQLAVLEAKIYSIPAVGEEDMRARAPAPAPAPASAPLPEPGNASAEQSTALVPAPPPPPPPPTGDAPSVDKEAEAAQPVGALEAAPPPEHMIKYTKMLKMGLPEGAVRLKMEQEGISASDAEALLQAVS